MYRFRNKNSTASLAQSRQYLYRSTIVATVFSACWISFGVRPPLSSASTLMTVSPFLRTTFLCSSK